MKTGQDSGTVKGDARKAEVVKLAEMVTTIDDHFFQKLT